jgi:ubiquitin carboxyl-terminal hydrolase 1
MNKLSEAISIPSMLFQNSNNNEARKLEKLYKSDPEFKRIFKKVLANGGFPGGLANDGNTCFMNSVIQSISSSYEFTKFLNSFINENNNNNNNNNNNHLLFSESLLLLINQLNEKHGNYAPTFNTKKLLKLMKDSPNKHLFLGYNQEDAQEFYQNLMKQVEKELNDFEKLQNIEIITNEKVQQEDNEQDDNNNNNDNNNKIKYVELPDNGITGLDNLGYLGNIYIPVSQLDPADIENENKFLPYKLITPVDGLQCDRIGCINCGEMGGIRYSVTSGLALNIPMEGLYRNRFTLGELINEFCKPEIIDGVECNRCGLYSIRDSLILKLENLRENETGLKGTKILIEKVQERIHEINEVLTKKSIDDEIYKKLHSKNMIKKSKKVKQTFYSRPPPLLNIHINRSVFDQRTFRVRKNNANIDFPLVLDMSDFVASINDINLDARLEFRKQDENSIKLDYGNTLKYQLKSVISHFGTHNYGHYIAFRKHRGVWWHISDETVRLSTEEEVLSSQGTFMLFYEILNDEDLKYQQELEKIDIDQKLQDNKGESDDEKSSSETDVSDNEMNDSSSSSETDVETSPNNNNNDNSDLEEDTEDEDSQNLMINIQANL